MNAKRALTLFALFVVAALSMGHGGEDDGGCGGHDDGGSSEMLEMEACTDADVYSAGMERLGTSSAFTARLVDAIPAPPGKGDNIWVVEILDSAGTPVDGATLAVEPFMPFHDHGTPIATQVMPMEAPGQFELHRVNLWMGGLWEVRLDIESGGTTDQAVFEFCVPD